MPKTHSQRTTRRPGTWALTVAIVSLGLSGPALSQQTSTASQTITPQLIQQTCNSYRDSLVQSLQFAEKSVAGGIQNPDGRPIPLTGNTAGLIRRSVLQGLIDEEPDRELRRIITQAGNRYLTTGRLDVFQQSLTGFDSRCAQVMPQRLSNQLARFASPDTASDTTPDRSNAPMMPSTKAPSPTGAREPTGPQNSAPRSSRLQLPEAAPLRR